LFLAHLKGPGIVWLQSLPMKRLRASLLGASMAQSRGGLGAKLVYFIVVIAVIINVLTETP
jgi:hypothetical protein